MILLLLSHSLWQTDKCVTIPSNALGIVTHVFMVISWTRKDFAINFSSMLVLQLLPNVCINSDSRQFVEFLVLSV